MIRRRQGKPLVETFYNLQLRCLILVRGVQRFIVQAWSQINRLPALHRSDMELVRQATSSSLSTHGATSTGYQLFVVQARSQFDRLPAFRRPDMEPVQKATSSPSSRHGASSTGCQLFIIQAWNRWRFWSRDPVSFAADPGFVLAFVVGLLRNGLCLSPETGSVSPSC